MLNAGALAGMVARRGGIPYVPHLILPWSMQETLANRVLSIDICKDALLKCDAMFVDPKIKYNYTEGMQHELYHCKEHGIKVLKTLEELDAFMEEWDNESAL